MSYDPKRHLNDAVEALEGLAKRMEADSARGSDSFVTATRARHIRNVAAIVKAAADSLPEPNGGTATDECFTTMPEQEAK